MALFDVRVLNDHGVWITDLVTGSKHYAQERAKTLIPRVHACEVKTQYGERFFLEGF